MYMISQIENKMVFAIINTKSRRYLSKSELIDIITGEDIAFDEFLIALSISSKLCFKFRCANDGVIVSSDEERIRSLMHFLKKAGILDDEEI